MNLDKNGKKISSAVIKRLPRYYRYLGELLKNDINRISSKELSERMKVTASQIRQDLNCFGGFGQQGYGYNVQNLYDEIGKILGVVQTHNIIIVGVGNLGQALANYGNFRRRGFILTGLFDINSALIGKKIDDIEIMDMAYIENFIKENNIDIALITTPRDKSAFIAEKLASYGIKGILNFSATDIDIPYDTVIENVHLIDSLMVLSYKIGNQVDNNDINDVKED